MEVSEIKRVLVLGAGHMGQQICLQCAMHGYEVVLYDIYREALDKAQERIKKLGAKYVSHGKASQEQMDRALSLISATTDPEEAAKGVDLVSESVPEDPGLKGKVFSSFNQLCPPHTVFTTNTSMLLPSQFAETTGRPEKFAALHFHDLRSNNVVDVMPHAGTDPEVVKLIQEFAKSIGQIVILLHRESNGYVFNYMLSSLLMSALTLAANGVTSIEDIDRAWMGAMNYPLGPFGIMDQIGLDTAWRVIDNAARESGEPQYYKNAGFIKQYVDKGYLGHKEGRGFYSYPDPVFARPGFLGGDYKE